MKCILLCLFILIVSLGCRQTTVERTGDLVESRSSETLNQEVEATIVRFDYTKYICGFSWIIQVGTKQYRAKTVSEPFQKDNQPVWIKYEETPNDGANCGFIVLTSVRMR